MKARALIKEQMPAHQPPWPRLCVFRGSGFCEIAVVSVRGDKASDDNSVIYLFPSLH